MGEKFVETLGTIWENFESSKFHQNRITKYESSGEPPDYCLKQ